MLIVKLLMGCCFSVYFIAQVEKVSPYDYQDALKKRPSHQTGYQFLELHWKKDFDELKELRDEFRLLQEEKNRLLADSKIVKALQLLNSDKFNQVLAQQEVINSLNDQNESLSQKNSALENRLQSLQEEVRAARDNFKGFELVLSKIKNLQKGFNNFEKNSDAEKQTTTTEKVSREEGPIILEREELNVYYVTIDFPEYGEKYSKCKVKIFVTEKKPENMDNTVAIKIKDDSEKAPFLALEPYYVQYTEKKEGGVEFSFTPTKAGTINIVAGLERYGMTELKKAIKVSNKFNVLMLCRYYFLLYWEKVWLTFTTITTIILFIPKFRNSFFRKKENDRSKKLVRKRFRKRRYIQS